MNGTDGAIDADASFLLAMIGGYPKTYEAFARAYFELELPPGLVNLVFNHKALDATILEGSRFSGTLEDLEPEAGEIGYLLA